MTVILVDAEERSIATHLRNISLNPIFASTSKRKLHEIESKALEMSSLRSTPLTLL
jgi:hypothetical protein